MKSNRQLLRYRGAECLNCYQPLDKSECYCHHCGQLNSTKRLTFNDFFEEFFSGIFAYDSRLYRTLRALLFKPGKISKDYIEGKRQRYANPYKFYLSVSILFFIFWGITHDYGADENNTTAQGEIIKPVDNDSVVANQVLEMIDENLAEKPLSEVLIPEAQLDTMNFWLASHKKIEIFSKYFSETEVKNPEFALRELKYKDSFYNSWLYDKVADAMTFESDIFIGYLLGKLPFIIFFFLPVFALFIWLLYVRRSYTYMEHLIFTFHNQTVLFVFFGIGLTFDYFIDTSMGAFFAGLAFLFYLYKALRHFYRQGRVKTFLKFLILNGLFFILALVAFVFSILASFAIF